jgi:Chitobiase/beta-hexosaminidase C-terminal domain/Legume lectin domain
MSAKFRSFRFPSPLRHTPWYSHEFASVPRIFAWFLLLWAPGILAQTSTPVPVLTWRYDLSHAGQNTNETALNPSNVNANSFGKLFALPVDSTVYAQPLYVPGLKMSDGLVHNVLFAATENDSIYAFDADSNGGVNANPIWRVSLLTTAYGAASGATAVPWQDSGSPDVSPTIGITGTPAIDPATNTMFVVTSTKENGLYFSRLHALNIITGKEQPNSPVNITATVAGTGNGSSGGQLSFSALWENQRPALDFYNGYVYIGYAAHGDNGPWHGWLFAYNATTLKQTAALCLSPNGVGAGIWAAGAGLPIDTTVSGGRMFAVTGNGTRSTAPPFSGSAYGESVVAFSLANGQITPVDEFTPFNFQILNDHDWDQGSGGLLMPPDQQGANPHLLITAGKEGRILVLNRDNLGGFASGASSNTNALQDISDVIPQANGFWSTAAYWNGNVYFWAEYNVPMLFKLNSGVMSSQPDSQSTITSDFPDPTFSISSDGAQNGIAWAVRSDQFNSNGSAVLYAWDANDLTNTIYQSDTNATRDHAGPANKFSVPVVTNGKVYFAAHGEVDVYGLLNGQSTTAPPVISPNGGTFSASQTVTLSSATQSAAIYYTVDGSAPTPASTEYAGPITISADTTIKAMASAPGYLQSSVSSAVFTFTSQTPPVTFAPSGGTYGAAQKVTLSDADANAKIYYTANGSTPSASSTLYTGPINVAVSETIKAIALDPALQSSNVTTAAYVIQSGGASINFGNGFSSTAGLQLNGSAVATNDTRLQLTNGGLSQAGSVWWNTPINIQAFTTTFQFQLSNAQGNGFTFTIQNMGPTALGGNSAGLGYQDITKSVAIKFNFYNYNGEGADSTGVYTNGQAPVLPTVDISPSGIQLGSGDSIQAQVSYTGLTLTLKLLDLVTNKTFTMSQAINIPQIVGANTAYVGFTGGTGGLSSSQKLISWTYTTQAVHPDFSPGSGNYSVPQNVILSSKTPDAIIYYTTNGSTPTAASAVYSNPIPVSTSLTIKAIAISPTMGTSVVSSSAYVIGSSPGASFTLTGNPFTITWRGGSIHEAVTVTPSGGFTGKVPLTCSVTGPTGAVSIPTCTVSTEPATISGSAAVTGYVFVQTQALTTIGNYMLNVQGTYGATTQSGNIPFSVN